MKIIKLFIAVLLIQQTAFSQTLQDAKKAIESEYYYKAKKILLNINTAAPTVESNYYLGNVYLLTEHPDSAKIYFQKAADITSDSKNALMYVAMGKVDLLGKNQTEAQEHFDAAVKASKSKNAEIFYQIGDAFYKINNTEAIRYYEIAYSTDPNLIINLLAYGDAYLDMDKPGEAMTKYEQARAVNPNIAVIHLRIARVNSKTGKHAEAIASYEKAVALDPSLAVAWKELGEEYYLDGQFGKVKPCFDKYLELNAEDKETRVKIAITCYQIGDYECAINESRKVIADEPNNFVAWRIISYANYELGDTLRKTDPASSLLHFTDGYSAVQSFWNISDKKVKPLDYQYSARLAVEMKDTAKAIVYYRMATENDSAATPDMYTEYAKYLYTMKKYPEAIVAYTNKIAKFPGGALDYFFLGRSYFQTGDYVNADTIFAQFIIMQPNSPDGYLQRARTQVRIEGVDVKGGALPYYLKYIELGEKDLEKNKKNLVDAYLYCAVYYNSVKNDADACTFFTKAKAMDPNNDLVKQLDGEIPCK